METNQKAIESQAQEFIKKHPMGVLSTVSESKEPWGSAIYYVADEDFKFYFVTRTETLKYKNIESNPQAALTVADPETQTTLQATGKIEKIPAKDTIDIVFKKLAAIRPKGDVNWLPPLIKVHKGDWIVLFLTPRKLQFACYTEATNDINVDFIKTIIP